MISNTYAILSSLVLGILMIFSVFRFMERSRDRMIGAVGIFALFALSAALGLSSVLHDFSRMPPPFLLFVLTLFAIAFAIIFSPWGKRLAEAVPLRTLIGLQAFRILPEIMLDLAYRDGLAPVQMTYHGQNFDILSAFAAIILYKAWPKLKHPKTWALAYSVFATLLLLNVLSVAMMSTPTLLRFFMNEPANTFVAEFPYIWLPAIHVMLAILLHGFAYRRLWMEAKETHFGWHHMAT